MISELYNIKYILFIELTLLIIFAIYGFIPFFALMALILLGVFIISAFNKPVIAVHVLIYSILLDSFVPLKYYSSGHTILIAEIFFLLILALGVVQYIFNLDKSLNIPLLFWIWIPFLIWSLLVGILIAEEKIRLLSYWRNYFAGFFALVFTFYSIKDKVQLKSVIVGLIIWGLILSLLEIRILFELGGFASGILGLFLRKNLLTLGWGRSNYLAAFFVLLIPLSIGYLIYTESKKIKVFIIFALVIMSFAIILTLSRGGILALSIALIILLSRVLKARTFIPFIIVISIVAAVILLNPLTSVLFERISTLDTSSSVYSRINFYHDVWNAFLRHPITGVGIANLGHYATFVLPKDGSQSAHNIILGALGEVGVVGAILYFSIFGLLLKNAYFSFRYEKDEALKIFKWCFLSALLGGLIHSLVEPIFEGLQFSIIYWTLASVFMKLELFNTANLISKDI